MRTYVTYNSPYWRLRVGDFRTQAEAAAAAEELRQAFPRSAKEIRVVRDNINSVN
ncbi:MAG: SPOR domain-containing protein [Paramuribaculum sp.]|nr:SPOR domain-containing protein [Paramuribaculum sp.]